MLNKVVSGAELKKSFEEAGFSVTKKTSPWHLKVFDYTAKNEHVKLGWSESYHHGYTPINKKTAILSVASIELKSFFNLHSKRWISRSNKYFRTHHKSKVSYWHIKESPWHNDLDVDLIEDIPAYILKALKSVIPLNVDLSKSGVLLTDKKSIYKPKSFRQVHKPCRIINNQLRREVFTKTQNSDYPSSIEFIGFKQIVEKKKKLKITDEGIESPDADPWILLECKYAEYDSCGCSGYKLPVLIKKNDYYILNKHGTTYGFPRVENPFILGLVEKAMIKQLMEAVTETI